MITQLSFPSAILWVGRRSDSNLQQLGCGPSCAEIAKEIERGLDFLKISARDLPERHRSMRAVFDHSWKLLSDEEQSVLSRLSVFQGEFSLEAAEQIAGATIFTLSNLVTK